VKQLITEDWRPKSWTKAALKRDGYTDEQRVRLGEAFIKNKKGQEITNPGKAYIEFFRNSETPRNPPPKKPDNALKAILAKQTNKSKDGPQRAKEAKTTPVDEAMQKQMNAMIKTRWKRFSISGE